jgi:hypothetical protein
MASYGDKNSNIVIRLSFPKRERGGGRKRERALQYFKIQCLFHQADKPKINKASLRAHGNLCIKLMVSPSSVQHG